MIKIKLKNKPKLFIISSPSGAGKTTLIKLVMQKLPNLIHSVSFTTRKMRKNEINGVDYNFISEKEFLKKIENDDFLEWAKVHNHYYGTDKHLLQSYLNKNLDVLLDIDVQGALQIKKKLKNDAVLIFVLTPSKTELKNRLLKRKSESPDLLKIRLHNAEKEIKYIYEYDYLIINDKLDEAVEDLKSIIISERLKVKNLNINQIMNIWEAS